MDKAVSESEAPAVRLGAKGDADGSALTRFDKERLFKNYPRLAEIDDPVWNQAVKTAHKMKMPGNYSVYEGFSRCNSFVLLLAGNVRVYYLAPDGREITLYRVSPGDLCVLSLSSLLNGRQYDVIAKTESEVHALGISEADFRHCIGRSEKFRDFVLSTLSDRLCDLMCLVQDTAFQTLQVRLACLLVRLFAMSDSPTLSTTHQSLAHEIGTTREVISRILKEFEHKNCIKISRGVIRLLSFSGLEKLAKA